MTPRNQVIVGDIRKVLATLAPSSVDCIVTSPPFFGLRNYGVAGQMGLEDSVDQWVDELRAVARGLARVLRPTGTLWLNLGDSFSRHSRYGAPAKSLLLGPERLVLALQADGWIVRNKIIWAKTNPQPSSVSDRLTCTWEVVYFLTRHRKYHFDLDAVRVPHRSARVKRRQETGASPTAPPTPPPWAGPLAGANHGLNRLKARGLPGHPLGKNPGDVWALATAGYRGAHFAVFPERLVERPIRAACPERVCIACDQPWQRTTQSSGDRLLRPDCRCGVAYRPGLVLDCFMGSGTVGVVAERLGRDWLGIDLSPSFATLARQRIEAARIDAARKEVAEVERPAA